MEFLGLSPGEWLEIGRAVLLLVVAAVVGRMALWLLDRVFVRIIRHTPTSFDDSILDAIRVPLFWFIMFIALQVALNRLSFLPPDWRERRADILFVLHLLIVYMLAHKLIGNLMRWYQLEMARRTASPVDEQIIPFVRRVTLVGLAVVALIVLLSHFGVNVSALVTTLGITSLAIALAAQNTLSDTISGFAIIADRPFAIGDRIEILELDTWGDVLDIGLRSTRILTRDNRTVVVPNSVISKNLVVNHSQPNTVYRVQTHVGVAYGTDVDHARRVMVEAIRAQDWVMQDKKIEALFIEFGESALIFRVRCWIEHYVETRRILDKMNSCLYRALNEAGIEIAFPTRVLYHRLAPEDGNGLVAVLREQDR